MSCPSPIEVLGRCYEISQKRVHGLQDIEDGHWAAPDGEDMRNIFYSSTRAGVSTKV